MLHELVQDLSATAAPPGKSDVDETEVGLLSLPEDIALLERLRASAYATLPNLTRVPTDVFVWRAGEPSRREVTKIAGLPYRQAGLPWPLAPSGEPLTFVAQFCFADSRDLVPPLPGDILLIFARGELLGDPSLRPDIRFELHWGGGLTFEWATLGTLPLVEVADIPPTLWPVQPCYGALQRLWDYRGVPADIAVDVPAIVEGTKIGGLCPWLDEPDYVRFDLETNTPGAPGIYLGTLASVAGDVYAALPGLPRDVLAAPTSHDPEAVRAWRQAQTAEYQLRSSRALMIADVGLLNFFLDDRGRIRWTAHCET
jgi:Domain of unknown function (DUF1963)